MTGKSLLLFCVSILGRLRDLQFIFAVTSGSPSICGKVELNIEIFQNEYRDIDLEYGYTYTYIIHIYNIYIYNTYGEY